MSLCRGHSLFLEHPPLGKRQPYGLYLSPKSTSCTSPAGPALAPLCLTNRARQSSLWGEEGCPDLAVKSHRTCPETPWGPLGFTSCVSEIHLLGSVSGYGNSVPWCLPKRCDKLQGQSAAFPAAGVLTHLCSAHILHPEVWEAVGQSLLSPSQLASCPEAREQGGGLSELWSSGSAAASSSRGARLSPEAEAGGLL